jgi:Fibronectin type III domain
MTPFPPLPLAQFFFLIPFFPCFILFSLKSRLAFLPMPQQIKQLNCPKTKPLGSAIAFISVLFFSIFLIIAYPSTTASAQTHKIFFPFVSYSKAIDITLAWDPNTDSNLAGYKLFIGLSSRNYTQVVDVGKTEQYTIRDLIEGTVYFFALTAYNQNGLESGFSNEIQYP